MPRPTAHQGFSSARVYRHYARRADDGRCRQVVRELVRALLRRRPSDLPAEWRDRAATADAGAAARADRRFHRRHDRPLCARRAARLFDDTGIALGRDLNRVTPTMRSDILPPHRTMSVLPTGWSRMGVAARPAHRPSRVAVEPPRDPAHGDMATNAAMVLAKDAGKKPRDLARRDRRASSRRRR